jgi:hypothetical protein
MKLMKATLWRLWRLTRSTSIVVSLTVMVALVAGTVSLAAAAPTASVALLKGVENTVSNVTSIVGTLADDPILRLDNNGTGPALDLQVASGNAPMTVNADAGKATNLDADKLDGKDSTDFAAASTVTAFTARTNQTSVTADTLVGRLELPAGSYVINAKVSLRNSAPSEGPEVASCQLRTPVGGIVLDRGESVTLEPDSDGSDGFSGFEYPLQATVTDFGGGRITFNCLAPAEFPNVLARNAIITAIKVGSVQVQPPL